jgi:uncharacterized protein YjbI with pentapeptide repeats
LASANLQGACLRDAGLTNADLTSANLTNANLTNADLRGAYLWDASLTSADLRGANLGNQWVIQGASRSDGYQFILSNLIGEGVRLRAGCRNFNLPSAYKHWIQTRSGTQLGNETMEILDNLWSLAFHRGYLASNGEWINEHKHTA